MLVLTPSIFTGEKQKFKTSEEYDTGVQNEQITDLFLPSLFSSFLIAHGFVPNYS